MPLYEVSLSRTYVIKIEAKSAQDAAVLSEFFLGYKDDSTENDKETFGLELKEIDSTANDVLEINGVEK
ncbi:MAG: hypothetical protein HUU11_02085 [Anaerolineales bacterium]|nr:hypothetical protein [Anaerolineales bacterium]NUQ83478.1 hypothetical protein [Anaerolineales bacterium]